MITKADLLAADLERLPHEARLKIVAAYTAQQPDAPVVSGLEYECLSLIRDAALTTPELVRRLKRGASAVWGALARLERRRLVHSIRVARPHPVVKTVLWLDGPQPKRLAA